MFYLSLSPAAIFQNWYPIKSCSQIFVNTLSVLLNIRKILAKCLWKSSTLVKLQIFKLHLPLKNELLGRYPFKNFPCFLRTYSLRNNFETLLIIVLIFLLNFLTYWNSLIGILLRIQNFLTHVFKGKVQFLSLFNLQNLGTSWVYINFPWIAEKCLLQTLPINWKLVLFFLKFQISYLVQTVRFL